MIVNFSKEGKFITSHALVQEGLKALASFAYRTGYNRATGESDGSGIRFYGLPTPFFNKLIKKGDFKGNNLIHLTLKNHHYALGQFFLANEAEQQAQAKTLIETCANQQNLTVVGWRNLENAMNLDVLSGVTLAKKPAIWQALVLSNTPKSAVLSESSVIEMSHRIYHEAQVQQIILHTVSLSTEKIVYKGMIPAPLLDTVYLDLQEQDFTAHACDTHARFATNTSPQWSNAQPCPNFISHNGELNSALGNAKQMSNELRSRNYKGVYPNKQLSDSMQFDADLANQITMKNIPLEEALTRLMAPDVGDYTDEIKAMLKYWALERTPYNGPAFIVAGAGGYFIAKLDSMGLRPSRWILVKDKNDNRCFYAASDDFVSSTENVVISKGHLEPGGMIMLTPQGELLQTQAILERIAARYNQTTTNYFQHQLQQQLVSVPEYNPIGAQQEYERAPAGAELQRILYAAGWNYESEDQVVRFMAENACERTAAMGDDTNILYTHSLPPHISYFFHQLFAQVSAPPLDSIKERDRFSLNTFLGGSFDTSMIEICSPILSAGQLHWIEHHKKLRAQIIDISFFTPLTGSVPSNERTMTLLSTAIRHLLQKVEKAISESSTAILILSDKNAGSQRAAIPDLIAVAGVRKFLESKNLDFKISIVIDSYQINGPHQMSTLLALGAKAIYPRGAYAKIHELFPGNPQPYYKNYKEALQKCLLKTMGKMGITDVNNYINSSLVAALGLDLSPTKKALTETPTLSAIFASIYSPLKGVALRHISQSLMARHQQAFDPDNEFILLPRSGYYMPEKEGIKHGFGPEIINAFTSWMKEEDLNAKLYQMHLILQHKGYLNFITDISSFSIEQGFLDPRIKNSEGFYPSLSLEQFKPSAAFKKLTQTIENYRRENPISLHDYFVIKSNIKDKRTMSKRPVQSQQEIRSLLFSGSMSQGALTVADPKTPNKLGAHETLTRGMNAIGAKSASGEGGESPLDLRQLLTTTRSKQFASGRFGVSAEQVLRAEEIEIKIAQGAKPGEGGELPGTKVSIRFAAQRGGLPHLNFISPPPHHDIYSIEDLEQLIHDIKSVNYHVKVAVKLVASQGIGTIAVGVAKAGADVINIASNSGGTGASQQSSIKHAGFPAELGLAEVDKALRQTRLRDFVQLRVSGGFKTAEEIIIAAILGADLFEIGTTAMLTLGCKMQRTCNLSCQPGVATEGHLFKGDQINTERYFVNLAAGVQERLIELGFHSLYELRNRTDLLHLLNQKSLDIYDFSAILERKGLPPLLNEQEQKLIRDQMQRALTRPKEDKLIRIIQHELTQKDIFTSKPINLTTQDRSFGARIVGILFPYLHEKPQRTIMINTTGNAGQSFGFLNASGMILKHIGTVQDGCAKSMTGGELILCTPPQENADTAAQNTIAGNAMLYGASGGKIYVNGKAGHRFGILLKGAEVIVEGVGDFAFEYMTSGTGMILGKAGKGLGTGASGGILFAYDPDNSLQPSNFVRTASAEERNSYSQAIRTLLKEHKEKTNSSIAKKIIQNFNLAHFKVLIPTEMDKINQLRQILDVIHTYRLRKSPLTQGMHVWLTHKALTTPPAEDAELEELREIIQDTTLSIFSPAVKATLSELYPTKPGAAQLEFRLPVTAIKKISKQSPKTPNPVEKRLMDIHGILDHELLKPLDNILAYITELTQDANGCSGCRAQSCAGGEKVDTGCPSGKGINTINSLLKKIGSINEQGVLTKEQWHYLRQAFAVQIQESPFISYTGAACPAPCQDSCTETIPHPGDTNEQRGGKRIGEHVHIKDIEFDLYQIGRALGWFDGKKRWAPEEISLVFGKNTTDGLIEKHAYDELMQHFKPPFCLPQHLKKKNKELIIIGSGPAGMQIAYKALLDGIQVRMYEKSDKAGGLLVDGIPAHKFDKTYLNEDFVYLQAMGLELHLNSEVFYEEQTGDYRIKNDEHSQPIANSHNENQYIALCIGTGQPKSLAPAITTGLSSTERQKLVQAIDFLKATNDIANELNKNPTVSLEEKEALIKKYLAHMDPRHKKIVVIGGGDTAQDVIRWVARYFNQTTENLGDLNILVRGYQPKKRAIMDAYPSLSRAATYENKLKKAEVTYVQGTELFLVEPVKITANADGTLNLQIKQSKFKYAETIKNDARLTALFDALPRELKPIEQENILLSEIDQVDLILCALGFEGTSNLPLVHAIKKYHLKNVYIAGDATGTGIIVAAQNNANKIYSHIKKAMGIQNIMVTKPSTVLKNIRT
ncbi:hypothetical protein LDG_7846 [Legionella drancourtii LLAP12]|uniref:Glutamine amidotransferase type-2 domain-containing protein n=2 Tax=Legionella drancourtii TaxID=168933 RepID=G9ERD4_9GAMM|nr:hypothetical protein LDG_7846 [Legionella drancourtii LLAP12]